MPLYAPPSTVGLISGLSPVWDARFEGVPRKSVVAAEAVAVAVAVRQPGLQPNSESPDFNGPSRR
jgi:hypothetical protein